MVVDGFEALMQRYLIGRILGAMTENMGPDSSFILHDYHPDALSGRVILTVLSKTHLYRFVCHPLHV
jgi:hypothetical protein